MLPRPALQQPPVSSGAPRKDVLPLCPACGKAADGFVRPGYLIQWSNEGAYLSRQAGDAAQPGGTDDDQLADLTITA